jgi:hypothetical protein
MENFRKDCLPKTPIYLIVSNIKRIFSEIDENKKGISILMPFS